MSARLLGGFAAAVLLAGTAFAQDAEPSISIEAAAVPKIVLPPAQEAEHLRGIATAEAQLRLGDLLRDGLPVSADNPLRRKDLTGARIAYQTAFGLGGRRHAGAATRLAKLMLEGEGGVRDASQGRRLLQTALELGSAEAAQILATHFETGEYGERNPKKAEELYRTAFRLGNSKAGADLVRMLGSDTEIGKETAKVTLKRLEQEAAEGQVSSAVLLGDLLLQGIVSPPDEGKALHWYRLAAQQGSDTARFRLARVYAEKAHDAGAGAEARTWMEGAAEAGRTDAAIAIVLDGLWGGKLGFSRDAAELWLARSREVEDPRAMAIARILEKAEASPQPGLDEDLKSYMGRLPLKSADANVIASAMLKGGHDAFVGSALTLFDYSAGNGDADGKYLFAKAVLEGLAGLHADRTKALQWLHEAAGSKAGAAILLARAYLDGTIAERSPARAKELYRSAIDHAAPETRADAITELANLLLDEGSDAAAAEAVAWYERAVDLGHVDAMISLGRLYAEGQRVPRDRATASLLLRQAAQDGHPDGQLALADFLMTSDAPGAIDQAESLLRTAWERGDARAVDRLVDLALSRGETGEAAGLLKDAADAGHIESGLRLIRMQAAAGKGADRDLLKLVEDKAGSDARKRHTIADALLTANDAGLRQEAERILRELSKGGNADARIELAGLAARGEVGANARAEALAVLEADSALGNAKAKAELARILGANTADPDALARAFRLNAEILEADPANAKAALNIARAHAAGLGVVPDQTKAFTFHERAARLGNASAMTALATSYAYGVGTERNLGLAETWFVRAAAGGDVQSMVRLADFYGSGEAGDLRPEHAMALRLKAARLGSPDAMVAVAHAYLAGAGLPQDREQGLAWLKRGIDGGHSRAALELARVHTLGSTAGESAEAQSLLKQAAEAGDPDAMYRYAIALTSGPDAAKHAKTALEWLHKALAAERDVAARDIARLSPLVAE